MKALSPRTIVSLASTIALSMAPGLACAQDAETSTAPSGQEDRARQPSLTQTFAPTGLLAEANSVENFGAFQSRLGVLRAHQGFADATGVRDGYSDTLDNFTVPVKAIIALDGQRQTTYLKIGAAYGHTNARKGNLTEVDTGIVSGQASILYRPATNIVLGLGAVAFETDLEFRHNQGDGKATSAGIQAEYLHRMSDSFGVSIRAIHDAGTSQTRFPLGKTARSIELSRDFERFYVEASAIANFTARQTSLIPSGFVVRPVLSVLYQETDFEAARDSLGRTKPRQEEKFGTVRGTIRIEKAENRPWKLAPYLVGGLEQEIANSVSSLHEAGTQFYLKAGLGTNVAGKGRLDAYYARDESFDGTYSASKVLIFLSLNL